MPQPESLTYKIAITTFVNLDTAVDRTIRLPWNHTAFKDAEDDLLDGDKFLQNTNEAQRQRI